jgi:hypothetical protein
MFAIRFHLHLHSAGFSWGHPCVPGALWGLFERHMAKNAMVK